MTDNAGFWDGIADKYAARPIDDPDAYARKLRETQEVLRPHMRLVEFGCGTGGTALAHAPHVASVLGIDVSERMLTHARQKAEAAGAANVTFRQGAIETADLPDGSADAVLTMSLLHLLPDRPAALARIHRLLAPGGLYVSSTVCLGDKLGFLKPLLWAMKLLGKAPPTVSFLREDVLLAEIRAAGFAVERHWRPKPRSATFVIARKAH